MPVVRQSNYLLFIIIFSQFAGTSLWFAGNAVIDQLSQTNDQAKVTAVVQFGFIAGTLLFSVLTLTDRFSSKAIFFLSSLLAALANLLIIWFGKVEWQLSCLRFVTGFFLAGIYPVGMKIAADLFPEKLGRALGFLVGALVLGTAFPHFVRSQLKGVNWQFVIAATSILAVIGGILIAAQIPSNKNSLANTTKLDYLAAFRVFQSSHFRSAAFGYFGHMWELYAFWSVLPLLFAYRNQLVQTQTNVYFWSFLIIAIGALGCAIGGMFSQQFGSKRVAYFSLLASGICCLLLPAIFKEDIWFFIVIIVWGFTVTADSPQFSALVAKAVDTRVKGTALTIVTSIGFSITIVSIQVLKGLFASYKEHGLWLLACGPLFGLLALKKTS